MTDTDAVHVQQHPDDADGNHSATLRGHGLRLTMRLRHDAAPISASQAADLAASWAAMLVDLTGGDHDV
jgi:hypothetical protein